MIFTVIQYSIVSLVFISIVHYLIIHLTDNLTTPQVRDIVTSTNQQYEAIIKKLENSRKRGDTKRESGDMKDDLKQYLKSLNSSTKSDNNSRQFDSQSMDFTSPSMPNQQIDENKNQTLMTYDSSDSVFGNYDGDAYSNY